MNKGLKDEIRELEDHELLELIKEMVDERFAKNQYSMGFDPQRHIDSFIVSLKLQLDWW